MYRFGPFEVDFTRSELRKNAIRVRIQEQPLRVLEALLLRPGELVTREELRDRLWPSDTFVDFEPSLNAAVAKLRQALSDSAEQPLYVETLARKGYRFIAPLSQPAGSPELPPIVEPAPAAIAIRKNNFLPWIVVGVLASCLALSWLVLWRTLRNAEEKPLVWLDLDVADDVSQPTVSPDGTKIIFVTKGRLAVRRVDQAQIRPLPDTEGASSPFFSPSGQWVGFFANRKLWKIALDGGAPVELCDAPVGRGGSWGEDGRIIAALNATGGLSSVPASGGDPQLMTELGGGDPRVTNHRWPHALPDGKGVLFVAGTGPAIGSLQVLPPGGRSARTLVEYSSGGRYLSSGYLVYDQNGTLFAAPMDLNRLELKAPPMPLLEGVAYDHFRGAEFDVSSSGTLVYRKSSAGPNRIVAWLDSTGGMEPILAKPGDYSSPRVSPDGKRLALVANWEGAAQSLDLRVRAIIHDPVEFRTEASVLPRMDAQRRVPGVLFRGESGVGPVRWQRQGRVAPGFESHRSPMVVFPRRQLACFVSPCASDWLRHMGRSDRERGQNSASRYTDTSFAGTGHAGGARHITKRAVVSLRFGRIRSP